MASEDCFRRLLEINKLVCKEMPLADSKYPMIFEIYAKGFLVSPIAIFGMTPDDLRQHDKYEWIHERLVDWIKLKQDKL